LPAARGARDEPGQSKRAAWRRSDFSVADALGAQIDGAWSARRLHQCALAHSDRRHVDVLTVQRPALAGHDALIECVDEEALR